MADSRLDIDHRCGFCWQFINSTSDPRVLPCKHISCMSCLNKEYEEHKGAECPVCKIFHELADVSDVPKFVLRKAEDTTTWYKCHRKGCRDKPVTNFCVDCVHKLCEDHLQTHQAHFDDEHDVVSIHMLVDSPKKCTKVCCEHHKNQQITRACEKCQELLCNDCEPSEHCMGSSTGHQIRSLSALTEKVDLDYKQLLNSVDEKITAMCESRKKCWTNLDDEEEKCNKWINEIKRIHDEQIKAIREDSCKVIEKVEEYREMATNETETFEAELMKKKEQLEEFRGKVHRLTRDEHVTELIRQKQQVIEEMIKNLDVEIGSCKLLGQHELINNGQTAHLNVRFLPILPIPSSLVHRSTHDIESFCYATWYRENGDVLIGCSDGVRLFHCKSQSLTKYDTQFHSVQSVIQHGQLIYILHFKDNMLFVELCEGNLKRIETLFEFSDDGSGAPKMSVSEKYIVVYVPTTSKPRHLIIYDFASKTCKYTQDIERQIPYFLPNGTVLIACMRNLKQCSITDGILVPIWQCEGLRNLCAVSSDSRGLIYGYTFNSQQSVYIISQDGQKLCELKHDLLPKSMGTGTVSGNLIAIPGWYNKTLSIYQLE